MSGFGETWTKVAVLSDIAAIVWKSVACSSDGKYVLLGNLTNTITVSSDYGETWQPKVIGNFVGNASAMNLSGQYQLTANTVLYRSNTSGTSWIQLTGPLANQSYTGLCISSTGQFQYACSKFKSPALGTIIKSDDFGETWTTISDPLGNNRFTSIATDNTGQYVTVVASLPNPGIWTSSNGGETWSDNKLTTEEDDMVSVAMSGDGTYQTAVGSNGLSLLGSIYSSNDHGETWSSISSTDYYYLLSIRMDSTGRYRTTLGVDNMIFVSRNSGNTWILKGDTQRYASNAISSDGVYQYATYSVFPSPIGGNVGVYRSTSVLLTINGSGKVKVGSITYNGPTTTFVLPGIIEAVSTDTSIFTRWAGINSSTSPIITVSEGGTLTANFAEAPVVTHRKYWPSQTELTDDSKPCRCGCFKVAANYTSAEERARAIRFAAAGCGCCRP